MQKIFEGNRGEIFLIDYFDQKAILKKQKRDKPNTIHNEIKMLQKLQPLGIVPKIYEYGSDYIVMEYIEGISMKEALKRNKKRALRLALEIGYILDKAHIWHTELGRYYHLIFDQKLKKCKVIDFERAKESSRPRNLLQIVGFYCKEYDLKEAIELYKKEKSAGYKKMIEALDV
ncbi:MULTISPECIES: RIO1 family regulatory kinase/ATPase [unclassified Nitratiruptor]|uniref:RIO1 family regulatory kinase/ATPase domain-containing protein n=1 Tax=unclassified Nitratiruptor TaxID=2624044 RepID=UPI001916A9CB|nr:MULTISPECIES: RIO1 family regulatory kinase/ATPase [unclassified Nitratiruptor]BCD60827.1 hypothetical protein NitYY0810_C1605 [Nitratiruptor sp. YY08-10]BCD64759.1 putative serine/threonine protein kinase [Nitratiruptor sp. YY08-14]